MSEAGSGADSDADSAVGSDTGGWAGAGGVFGIFDRLKNFNHIDLALPEIRPQHPIRFRNVKTRIEKRQDGAFLAGKGCTNQLDDVLCLP